MSKGSYFILLSALAIISSCDVKEQAMTADEVINKAIETHGGERYDNMLVEFDFRNRHFKAKIQNGQYVYERSFRSDEGWVRDIYQKDTFSRMINDRRVVLSGENRRSFQNGTNSVIYFALLPFHLDDPVINRQLMRSVKIKNEPYYKVEVTFGDGGGENFESTYVYWVHKKNFTVDYLAYSFNINGGGVRFREASEARVVEGVRFQNYRNYTIKEDYPTHELDYAFEQGKLELVSEINLENIQVRLLAD